MIDFLNAKRIVAPKGEVVEIARGDEILWSKNAYKKELAYLESTGTQWIDTGFIPNQDTRVVCTAIVPVSTSTNWLFGTRYSGSSKMFTFAASASKCYAVGYGATQYKFSDEYNSSDVITVDFDKETVTLTANSLTGSVVADSAEFTCPDTLVLFAEKTRSTVAPGKATIYSCQIYDNNVLIRDYVPVLDWDDAPCMYDKVSGELFYNQGTDDFSYGGDT